ncbi:MAG TPA: hypothetical protein VIS07_09890 [Candidatus Binatia bacterium]
MLALLLVACASSACRDRAEEPAATATVAATAAAPAAAATATTTAISPATAPGASAEDGERPYSVQLHVHGSFSEGIGSIDSHSYEATDVGADVIWWSDHDFRIATWGHVSTFGFEDWSEDMPEAGLPGRRRRKGARERKKQLVPLGGTTMLEGTEEFVTDEPREGAKSLRVETTNESDDFVGRRYALTADRGLFKRPLASEVTLELSVLPEALGEDARAVIDITLSEHPPREGLPFTVYHLRYVLGGDTEQPYRDGTTFVVPVPWRPGEWNDLALPVSRDAVRGFPFIHGEDNSLSAIVLGVEARRGATARVRFDDLRIQQELSGTAAFERQGRLIDEVARDYPKLRQLQGVELSWLGHHLNEFSVDTRLVDYERIRQELPPPGDESWRMRLTRRLIEDVHARGGLVSYNHMFGAMMEGARPHATREEVLDELVANEAYGADILEVGYRDRGGHPLADHLWVWDQLAQHGLFLVGTGVSDSHGGPDQRWRTDANNFVSWIYARSPEKADLLEGLRAGRVFFGDLVLFDGSLDLITKGGARMGQIVVTDAPSEVVQVRIDGLAVGDDVRLIVSGNEAARWSATTPLLVEPYEVTLDETRPTVVRVEVFTADGKAKVFSNPITFVREPPAGERLGARLVDLR